MLVRVGLLICWVVASRSARGAEPVDYVRDIKPILSSRCFACHSALRQRSGLRLDAASLLTQGGKRGPAIVPGKSGESLLITAVTGAEGWRMPPEEEGDPLDAEQIALLAAWIDQGAKAPDEPIPSDPRSHWAYQSPERPPIPNVNNRAWVRNPIDAFIAAGHEKHALAPVADAPKHVLLRRVYLDLIGLPPTRAERDAFWQDKSPDAYRRVVERLLASPRYGERWGRHWMDVWRYSDWSGYRDEVRYSQRHIWRWRDWIIESLNDDKGYDRMVVEMLAGDEAAPTDPDTLRATGYLVRSWYKFNRDVWLDQTVEHAAKAFLGLTINCARCHDHKYDPIAQADYYRLRAFFEPHEVRTDRVPGQADVIKDGLPRVVDAKPDTPTYLFIRGNEKMPDKEHPLAPGLPDVLSDGLEIEPVAMPLEAYYPALTPFVLDETRNQADADVTQAVAALTKANEALEKDRSRVAATGADAAKPDPSSDPALTARVHLAEKQLAYAEAKRASLAARVEAERAKYKLRPYGDHAHWAKTAGGLERHATLCGAELSVLQAEQALAKAEAADKPEDAKTKKAVTAATKTLEDARKKLTDALTKTSSEYTRLGPVYPATSTGRRTALARWMTERDNPLTARVAVNHIWMRHIGEPLVAGVDDFGLRAQRPRHAALLDWLAVELIESGWRMKPLHRLILMSNTYRMRSDAGDNHASNRRIDPDNHGLWRMNRRRLEAEVVRDSMVHVAGNLDLAMGGPEIDQNLGQSSLRRSVYFRHAYEKQMKFLELFDAASVNECYRRSASVVPQQALALSNSALSFEQARLLARRIPQSTDAFIAEAFERVLSRSPSAAETAECRRFLTEQEARLTDATQLTSFDGEKSSRVQPAVTPSLRARESLVHVLLNHNDFVTVR